MFFIADDIEDFAKLSRDRELFDELRRAWFAVSFVRFELLLSEGVSILVETDEDAVALFEREKELGEHV